MEDLRDEARPTRGRAALLGGRLFNLALFRLLHGAISAHSIGIVAVEVGAMLPQVRDVIRHSRQPFQRSCEMACFSMSRASSRSRKSRIRASPSHVARGWKVPSSENAPSVMRMCRWTCHCKRSAIFWTRDQYLHRDFGTRSGSGNSQADDGRLPAPTTLLAPRAFSRKRATSRGHGSRRSAPSDRRSSAPRWRWHRRRR